LISRSVLYPFSLPSQRSDPPRHAILSLSGPNALDLPREITHGPAVRGMTSSFFAFGEVTPHRPIDPVVYPFPKGTACLSGPGRLVNLSCFYRSRSSLLSSFGGSLSAPVCWPPPPPNPPAALLTRDFNPFFFFSGVSPVFPRAVIPLHGLFSHHLNPPNVQFRRPKQM